MDIQTATVKQIKQIDMRVGICAFYVQGAEIVTYFGEVWVGTIDLYVSD